jgi:hypothetical protein
MIKPAHVRWLWVFAPLIVSIILIGKSIQPGHNWGGDFALYIQQSEYILKGNLHELYELNKFAMDESQYAVGPYLYPTVFPVMLIPVELINGRDFVAMKWLCAFCFLFSIAVFAKMLFNRETPNPLIAMIIAMMAFHSGWVTFTDQVLSDLPFLLFVMLTFLFAEKQASPKDAILTAVFLLAAIFTRDAGVAMFPAIVVLYWSRYKQHNEKSTLLYPVITISLMITGYFLLSGLLPDGGANHRSKIIERLSWDVVTTNLQDNFRLLGEYFHLPGFITWMLLTFFVVGSFVKRKSDFHWIIFLGTYLAIVMVWPHFQGIRFLFPVIPFLLWFVVIGIQHILSTFKRFHYPANIVTGILCAWIVVQEYPVIKKYHTASSNECFTSELEICYEWLRNHGDQNAIIGCNKPTVVRLFTGLNCILSDEAFFKSSQADLLFLPKYLAPEWRQSRLLFDSGQYVVIAK